MNRKPVVVESDPFMTRCWFCNREYEYTSILKHVGMNSLCKAFYGPKFEEVQRRHANIRKGIYREEHGSKKRERIVSIMRMKL